MASSRAPRTRRRTSFAPACASWVSPMGLRPCPRPSTWCSRVRRSGCSRSPTRRSSRRPPRPRWPRAPRPRVTPGGRSSAMSRWSPFSPTPRRAPPPGREWTGYARRSSISGRGARTSRRTASCRPTRRWFPPLARPRPPVRRSLVGRICSCSPTLTRPTSPTSCWSDLPGRGHWGRSFRGCDDP